MQNTLAYCCLFLITHAVLTFPSSCRCEYLLTLISRGIICLYSRFLQNSRTRAAQLNSFKLCLARGLPFFHKPLGRYLFRVELLFCCAWGSLACISAHLGTVMSGGNRTACAEQLLSWSLLLKLFCRYSVLRISYMLVCNQKYFLTKMHEYFLAHLPMGGFTGSARSKIQKYYGVN